MVAIRAYQETRRVIVENETVTRGRRGSTMEVIIVEQQVDVPGEKN
jgi:hypothetical protein